MSDDRAAPRFWFGIAWLAALEGFVFATYAALSPAVTITPITCISLGFIAAVSATLVVFYLAARFMPWQKPPIPEPIMWFLGQPKVLPSLLIVLASLPLVALVAAAVFISPLSRFFEPFIRFLLQALPAIAWFLLVDIELLLLFLVQNWQRVKAKGFWEKKTVFQVVFILVILSTAVGHWIILVFELRIFKLNPGWFWKFHPKPFTFADLLFPILLAAVMVCTTVLLRRKVSIAFSLGMLILLGTFLQVGFGFMDGKGVESLRLKYTDSMHSKYAWLASDNPDIVLELTRYEEVFTPDTYLGTKPPGVFLVYILTQKLSNLVNPVIDFNGTFLRMTNFMAWVFPFISFLVIIPIFRLGRRFLDEKNALIPPLLYLVCPNVLLIPLFLDQVLYPLFFVAGMLLVVAAVDQHSFGLSLAAGAFIFFSAGFLSFSLLPLIPLPLLWVGLEYWRQRRSRRIVRMMWLAGGLVIGFLAALAIFRFVLNYDFFLRYTNAFARHREMKDFAPGILSLLTTLLLNSTDFFSWTGFPLVLLGLAALFPSLAALINGRGSRMDAWVSAAGITWLGVNLFGQTRGEVGRLWLFFVPLVCQAATAGLLRLSKKPERYIYYLVGLQLTTTFLIFKFQDFFA